MARIRVPRTQYLGMAQLRKMKREAYTMGNFREIARIDKMINFTHGKKR